MASSAMVLDPKPALELPPSIPVARSDQPAFANLSNSDEDDQALLIQSLKEIEKEVKLVLDTLGLLPPCTHAEVLQQLKDKVLKRVELTEDDILRFIEGRAVARKNKDFSESDQIRADLSLKGIALMNVGKETVWRPCIPVEQEQE